MKSRLHALVGLLFLASACATPAPETGADPTGRTIPLFGAETVIADQWQHLPLQGKTEYRITAHQGLIAIRGVGKHSASGLIRRVTGDLSRCSEIAWSWAVTKIQPSADLRVKERDDVAASIFLLFGDPGFLSNPEPVPTLRYVWTNERHSQDTVVDNPYMPGVVRSIVVRSGDVGLGSWRHERRNVAEDFKRAFGSAPTAPIHAIALFTDNDQTHEPVEAFYGAAKMVCHAAPS